MDLPDNLFEELSKALLNAYPNPDDFDRMLFTRFNQMDRRAYTTADGLQNIIFNLYRNYFKPRSKTADLLLAARESNPDNRLLFEIAVKAGLSLNLTQYEDNGTSVFKELRHLERIIRPDIQSLNIAEWVSKLGTIEGQVCRIEYRNARGAQCFGTGFLVDSDRLLTNYHVMEDVIENKVNPDDVILRFDYKILPDGTTISSGNIFKLASKDWLIDYAPYSDIDSKDVLDPLPGDDELDFALLLLEDDVGNRPIGENPPPGAKPRGWIDLPDSVPDIEKDSALIIIQHPKGEPLKLVLDTQAVILTNDNGTRVRYRTNTEGGSSGSPCFDINLNLVALHHSGDPDFSLAHKPTYNQGIPIRTIVEHLKKKRS